MLDGDFSVDTQSTPSSFPYTPHFVHLHVLIGSWILLQKLPCHLTRPPQLLGHRPSSRFRSHLPPPTNTHPPAINNSVYAYPHSPSRHAHHRPAPIGLGQPSTSARAQLPPSPANGIRINLPTEQHRADPVLLCPADRLRADHRPCPAPCPSAEQARTLNALRSGLLSRAVLGGGSMDITASLNPLSSPKPRQQLRAHSPLVVLLRGAALHPVAKRTRGRRREPGTESRWERTLARRGRRARHTAVYTPSTPQFGAVLQSGVAARASAAASGTHRLLQRSARRSRCRLSRYSRRCWRLIWRWAPGESRSCMYMLSFFGDILHWQLIRIFQIHTRLNSRITCLRRSRGSHSSFHMSWWWGRVELDQQVVAGGVSANSISRVMKVPNTAV